LTFAEQLAADRPIVTVMLLYQDLRATPVQLEDFGHRVGDGDGEAAALLKGPAPGNVDNDERHDCLLFRPLL